MWLQFRADPQNFLGMLFTDDDVLDLLDRFQYSRPLNVNVVIIQGARQGPGSQICQTLIL